MTQSPVKSSIWFLPAEPALTSIQSFVANCALISGTHVFLPHVTVLGDTSAPVPDCIQALDDLEGTISPQTAFPVSTKSGESFFTSYYMKLKGMEIVHQLNSMLRAQLGSGTPTGENGAPVHMSLAYGAKARENTMAFDRNLPDALLRSIKFDQVVLTNSHNQSRVEDWQVLHRVTLCGKD